MTVQTYALESLLYRTAGLIDAAIAQNAGTGAVLAAMEEFAVEASIAKVAGSETLNFVLDENVQIHGGNGFVNDYPAERHYRDARVNRIFEGTNEINRLLIPGMLARRAVKGDLPLLAAARKLQDEVLGPPPADRSGDNPLDAHAAAVDGLKKVALMGLGLRGAVCEDLSEHRSPPGIADIGLPWPVRRALYCARRAHKARWRRIILMLRLCS